MNSAVGVIFDLINMVCGPNKYCLHCEILLVFGLLHSKPHFKQGQIEYLTLIKCR